MAFSGDRIPGACGPTDAGPANQRRSLVLRGRRSVGSHLQGCEPAVNREHSVRHGSEQRTPGHPSLGGSRGGGGKRDSPRPNVRAIPGVRLYAPENHRRRRRNGRNSRSVILDGRRERLSPRRPVVSGRLRRGESSGPTRRGRDNRSPRTSLPLRLPDTQLR